MIILKKTLGRLYPKGNQYDNIESKSLEYNQQYFWCTPVQIWFDKYYLKQNGKLFKILQ